MRRVLMVFEVEDVKKEVELKSKIMTAAQIVKAKLRKIESKAIEDKWKYPSNIY